MQSREIFQKTSILSDLLTQSHGCKQEKWCLPRLPKPRMEWGGRIIYFRATNGRASMSGELKRSPCLNQFLEEFKYIFELERLISFKF